MVGPHLLVPFLLIQAPLFVQSASRSGVKYWTWTQHLSVSVHYCWALIHHRAKRMAHFTYLPAPCCVSINSSRVNYACSSMRKVRFFLLFWLCATQWVKVCVSCLGENIKQLFKQQRDMVIYHHNLLWRLQWQLTRAPQLTLSVDLFFNDVWRFLFARSKVIAFVSSVSAI